MKHLRGFAILSAIFILVVLAALGAFALTVSSNQQIGSALDLQGVKAYQAARAGIEWGLYRQLRQGYCATAQDDPFPDPLFGFTVRVECTPFTDTNSTPPIVVYRIQSTACSQSPCPNTSPGPLYIERRLSVTF